MIGEYSVSNQSREPAGYATLDDEHFTFLDQCFANKVGVIDEIETKRENIEPNEIARFILYARKKIDRARFERGIVAKEISRNWLGVVRKSIREHVGHILPNFRGDATLF